MCTSLPYAPALCCTCYGSRRVQRCHLTLGLGLGTRRRILPGKVALAPGVFITSCNINRLPFKNQTEPKERNGEGPTRIYPIQTLVFVSKTCSISRKWFDSFSNRIDVMNTPPVFWVIVSPQNKFI